MARKLLQYGALETQQHLERERAGYKILMQDIKIVRYARVGWNTRVIRAEARKEVAKVLDSMP